MLVIGLDLRRHVRVGEDGEFTVRLRRHLHALNVLIRTEADVGRRVAGSLDELRAGVLVEHPLAKRAKLLPLVASVLNGGTSRSTLSRKLKYAR